MADTHLADASRETVVEDFTPKPPFFFELSRLMVVAIRGGQLAYRAQSKPNGPWEANWTPIVTAPPFGIMAAGLTGDGRVAVVAQTRSPPIEVLYIDEKPNTSTQQWNAPVNLGRPTSSSALVNLSMALDADARIEVFSVGNNGAISWKYQNPNRIVQKTVTITPPGTDTPITFTVDEIAPPLTPWSDWINIDGSLAEIRALRNADGRIILFGINGSGFLYRKEQLVARALQPKDWSEWVQMNDAGTGTFLAGTLAPKLDRAGAVNLFAINKDAQVLHARQAPPGTATWAAWTTPGIITGGVRAVAAGIDGDDHLVVVATDSRNSHNATTQLDVTTQQWSGWTTFSVGNGPAQIALDYNADGRLTFFTRTPPGQPTDGLWLKSQMAFDSTEWEWTYTQLALDAVNQYGVVRDLTPPAS